MPQVPDIEARIDRLESQRAIERLIGQYAHAFDLQDIDTLRSIWHEGATLSLGEPFGNFTGVDAIVGAAHQLWSQSPRMHHWMSNAVIDIDGDTATATTALDCFVTNIESGPTQVGGNYHDRFERQDGQWGMVERVFDLHYFTPIKSWTPAHGSETTPLSVPDPR
ncbi:nuclear transport factor 2 family protein [Rhodococcus sp. NPDC059968]|uniref:nuclear transport factor 2 family protein n=1 Tax=Rhodococcus sp. NPDC059968 TaxID=3347017 RepID=UPI00366C29AA